jgi:3-deoxy-D-manno-octulosonate 8-phosphate phosphatase KdsC-like HAD superfamily phosphatase
VAARSGGDGAVRELVDLVLAARASMRESEGVLVRS